MSQNTVILLRAIVLLQSILFFALAWYTVRLKVIRCKAAFALLMLCLGIYSIAGSLESQRRVLGWVLFWNNAAYLGLVWTGPLWLIITGQYVDIPLFRHRKFLASLLIVPMLTLFFKFTDPVFHLCYSAYWLPETEYFVNIGFTKGPWYWVHMGYNALVVLAGLLIIFHLLMTCATAYRRQALALLFAALTPFLAMVAYMALSGRISVDIVPLSFPVSAALFLLSLIRYRFLEEKPLTLSSVLKTLNSGFLLLDGQGNLVEANHSIRAYFFRERKLTYPLPHNRLVEALPFLDRLDLDRDGQRILTVAEVRDTLCPVRVFADRLPQDGGRRTGMRVFLFFDWGRELPAAPAPTLQDRRDMERLDRYMQEKNAFLDPTLSLGEISRRLNLPRNRVSRLINQYHRKNFNDFVNHYRVTHAMSLLRSGRRNMLQVAYDSGFNSKSVFYAAFKKFTGTNPSVYAGAGKSRNRNRSASAS